MNETMRAEATIELYWSPGGRRIAWLYQGKVLPKGMKVEDAEWKDLKGFTDLVVDRAVGPRIEVAGPKELGPEGFDVVADALEKAGYAPTGQRNAAPGAKTVIYAVSGWKDDAARMAAVIPGGAVVKPLAAPRGRFEVVVVLGRTAVSGRAGAKSKVAVGPHFRRAALVGQRALPHRPSWGEGFPAHRNPFKKSPLLGSAGSRCRLEMCSGRRVPQHAPRMIRFPCGAALAVHS
jgi:hypothetical protein